MRILIVLVTLIVPAALAAQSNPAPGQLAAAIEAELGQIPANTGLYLKHLKTGEEVAVRADVSFNSQSVIKIPIMVRAFQLAEQGKLNLDERVTLGARRAARRLRRVSVRRSRPRRRPCAISSSR